MVFHVSKPTVYQCYIAVTVVENYAEIAIQINPVIRDEAVVWN